MTNESHIEPPESAVKRALDHAEFVERVPALQRAAAEFETDIGEDGRRYYRFSETGSFIPKFPHHHLVRAYSCELAIVNARRRVPDEIDLKTARRNFKKARVNYESRVDYRGRGDMEWSNQQEGERFTSLTAILEARAEAVFWRKIVAELEAIVKVKKQNAQAITRHRLSKLGLAY